MPLSVLLWFPLYFSGIKVKYVLREMWSYMCCSRCGLAKVFRRSFYKHVPCLTLNTFSEECPTPCCFKSCCVLSWWHQRNINDDSTTVSYVVILRCGLVVDGLGCCFFTCTYLYIYSMFLICINVYLSIYLYIFKHLLSFPCSMRTI